MVALREIFSDVAGLPFPELPVMAVAAAEALCKAVQGLLERIEDAYPLVSRSLAGVTSVLKLIFEQGCPITLVVVQRFSGEIQCTLDCEQRYLEDEALSLTMALDVETDSVSGRPHTACSTHSADSASERQSRVVEKNAGLCLEKPVHKASKVRSRLPCKYVAASFPALDGSSTSIRQSGDEITTHHGGKSDSPVRRSGSTFRNKLQAAKDENYFIDDYKLGVS